MFKQTGYYLEVLTSETMKLLGSIKNKTTKGENRENVPYLKTTQVILIHCNMVTTIINKIQETSYICS